MKNTKYIFVSILLLTAMIFTSCAKKDANSDLAPAPEPTPDLALTPIVEIEDDAFYTQMTESNTRPIAVMIDNDSSAARPQTGLENAYAIYEMMVEGTSTRLMALFKDCSLTKIGPVRSSRHYFLDYALEHDAIYAHCGYSPQAQSDISALDVDNINEMNSNNGKNFFRDRARKAPHNLYASLPELTATAESKRYDTETDSENVFTYHKKDTDLKNGAEALSINLPYSRDYTVSYKYDADKKLYERFINSSPHTTAPSGDSLYAKNIIVYQINNYSIDNEGRQTVKNIGSGKGYYISNGKSVPITWQKTSRRGKTVYKTAEGDTLYINPGNVYVQIVPTSAKITIE